MIDSYSVEEKTCFLKRMWNNIFHKNLMLEQPVEYTQKEVKVFTDNIIDYIKYRSRI